MKTSDVNNRIAGAQLIVEKAYELANALSLDVSRIWIQEPLLTDSQETHILTISAGGRTASVFLTGQALRDLNTGYGADFTFAKLRVCINELL
jgi:hypothetical protein